MKKTIAFILAISFMTFWSIASVYASDTIAPSLNGPFSGETITVKTETAYYIVHKDFKIVLDKYEEFFDSYIDFMNHTESPDYVIKYMEFLQEYTETIEEFRKYDLMSSQENGWTDDEFAYYTYVLLKIERKLINTVEQKNDSEDKQTIVTNTDDEKQRILNDNGNGLEEAMWVCPSCGNLLLSKFCPDCGTISPTPAPIIIATPQPTEVPMNINKASENVVGYKYVLNYNNVEIEGNYTGMIIDGFPHGYGLFEKDEWFYLGEWEKGVPNNNGTVYNYGINRCLSFQELIRSMKNELNYDGLYYYVSGQGTKLGFRFFDDGLVTCDPIYFTRVFNDYRKGSKFASHYEIIDDRLIFRIKVDSRDISEMLFEGRIDGMNLWLTEQREDGLYYDRGLNTIKEKPKEHKYVYMNDTELSIFLLENKGTFQ